MRSVRVVAAPASQSEVLSCACCHQRLSGPLAPHLCAACGNPQPVAAGEDYFTAFGLPRRFGVGGPGLQTRFYEISRALHPDRFSAKGADALKRSVERMGLVNDAYRTLKSRELLESYLLELEGIQPKTKPAIPMEFAEEWFELQDAAMEDPVAARPQVDAFEKRVAEGIESETAQIATEEARYDQSPERAQLEKIHARIQARQYLKSLLRDVARLKG